MSGFGQDAVPGHRRHRRPPLPVQLPVPEVPVQARPWPAVPVGRAQNRRVRRDRLVRKGFRRQGQPRGRAPPAGPNGGSEGADRGPAGGRGGAGGRAGTTGRGRAGRIGSLARRPGLRRVGPSGAGSLRLVGVDSRPDGRCAGSRDGLLAAPTARRRRLRVGLAGPVAGRTRPAAPADPRRTPGGPSCRPICWRPSATTSGSRFPGPMCSPGHRCGISGWWSSFATWTTSWCRLAGCGCAATDPAGGLRCCSSPRAEPRWIPHWSRAPC